MWYNKTVYDYVKVTTMDNIKEITHKTRQVLMGTRVIENRAKYYMLCYGCSVIHFVFTALFFYAGIGFLSGINIVATIFYIVVAAIFIPKEKYEILFILAFFEAELNAAISSILLGSGYDFMIYTLSLIPGAFYLANTWKTEKKESGFDPIPMASSLIVGFFYILVDVLYRVVRPVYTGDVITGLRPVFHYFNIMIADTLLLTFAILFALEVRHFQKLLSDENSRLGEMAARDPLTTAFNRRSFHLKVKEAIDSDDNISFGFVILDIDNFKKVNDTYGHIVGDKVLVGTATTLREKIRENDIFCRWGGEEFLVMVRGTKEECALVAERIRSSIAEQIFETENTDFSVTATLGIAMYEKGQSIRALVDLADQKLYYGKTHGKNQVVK